MDIDPPRLRSVKDARRVLGGMGLTKIYKLMADGVLTRVHHGGRAFITEESIIALVDAMMAEAEAKRAGQKAA